MPEVYATVEEVLASWPGLSKYAEQARQDLVDDANAAVRDHLNRELLLAERTEWLSGRNRPRLHLSVTPIVSVDALAIDGVDQDPAEGRAWTFDPRTGALYRGDGRGDPRFARPFPRGVRNVVATYTAGYDAVPGPVRRATILAARALHDLAAASGVYQFEMIGNYSYSLGKGVGAVTDAARDLLANYKASPLG